MQLKTFVKGLKEDLERLKKNKTDSANLLIDLESQLAIRQLEVLLDQYVASDVDVSVPKALSPFVSFLTKRWDRIKGTDAIPMHNPDTLATRIGWILAMRLGVELDINPVSLLIPTLKVTDSDVTNNKYSELKFSEYVLMDNNEYPVEIVACLNDAATNKGQLRATCRVDGETPNLSAAELSRVTTHSEFTQNYYKDILANKNKNKEKDLRDPKIKLTDAITKDNYSVHATYGIDGEKILENRLIFNRNILFADREQLINYMVKRLKPTEWDQFLSGFDPKTLSNLLLNGESFKNVTTAKSTYLGEELHDRAALFCMLHQYWSQRDAEKSEFSSYLGRLTGLGWSKKDKEVGVGVLKEFLAGTRGLGELNNFIDMKVNDKGRERIKAILYSLGSNLRIVADQIAVVGQIITDHQMVMNKQSLMGKKA